MAKSSPLAGTAAPWLLFVALLLLVLAPADAGRALRWGGCWKGSQRNEGSVTVVALPAAPTVFAPPPQVVSIYVPRPAPIAYPYPVAVPVPAVPVVSQPCVGGCGSGVVGSGSGGYCGGSGAIVGSGCDGPSAIGVDTSTVVRTAGKK